MMFQFCRKSSLLIMVQFLFFLRSMQVKMSVVMASQSEFFDNKEKYNNTTKSLQTSMCIDNDCSNKCRLYETPIQTCYNGQTLFPNDTSWSQWDIRDDDVAVVAVLMDSNNMPQKQQKQFRRSFYATQDSSCGGAPTDVYTLPIDECVGPFGKPRPWGKFTFLEDKEDNNDDDGEGSRTHGSIRTGREEEEELTAIKK